MALPTPRPFSREGGVIVLRPYIVPQNLDEKVTTRVSLCKIKKGMKDNAQEGKGGIQW
jgi:hypothetical protein